jgi:DNA polymerase III subunit beta
MKTTITLDKLKTAIDKCLPAVSKNNQNPELKCIYIEARAETLVFRSTNIDIGFETTVNAKVDVEGKFLILGEVLSRVVSSLNSKATENCEIELIDNVCSLKIGKHDIKLKTLKDDNFPTLPKTEGVEIVCNSKIFVNGLKSSVFSVAKSDIKPEIAGVFVTSKEDEIVFVGTDAYRLVERKLNIKKTLEAFSCIIPEKNVKEIIKLFENVEEDLNIIISKNSLSIIHQNDYFVTRLIEGNFPNYNQIIPQNPVTTIICLKEDFSKSLKVVALFSDKTQQINFEFTNEDCILNAENNEVGSVKESFKINLKGEGFSIKMNSKYLEEFLGQLKDDNLVLKYTAQNKAIILQGINDEKYIYLLMPSYR